MVDLRHSPHTSMGAQRVQTDPPEFSRFDIVSQNFCDKTTWYFESVAVVGEVLTDSGDQLTYTPAVARPWVDMTHGKLTGERKLRATYAPRVYVNDVLKTEDPPGANGSDYTIDYATGAVTFNAALAPTDVVKVDYHHVGGSMLAVSPVAGKKLRLTHVEVQFSENAIMGDTVLFQVYGLVDVFAPHLTPTPYPSGTKIPLGDPGVYQTMQDFINESEGAYPSIPKMGGDGWRGMPGPVHIFRWAYSERGTTDLLASGGMEIRVSLEDDNQFAGDVAIATFYGISENEAA